MTRTELRHAIATVSANRPPSSDLATVLEAAMAYIMMLPPERRPVWVVRSGDPDSSALVESFDSLDAAMTQVRAYANNGRRAMVTKEERDA